MTTQEEEGVKDNQQQQQRRQQQQQTTWNDCHAPVSFDGDGTMWHMFLLFFYKREGKTQKLHGATNKITQVENQKLGAAGIRVDEEEP